MVALRNVTKIYPMGEIEVQALRGVTLDIQAGEWVAVMGPSGGGKSTLMNIVGCLDTPTAGSYRLLGQEVASLRDDALAAIRNERIGFVFQTFNLLPRATALDQVLLPLQYRRPNHGSRSDQIERAREALREVGLESRLDHTPAQLSGGQRQRVAIARALVTEPGLLLADEPTGNLDSESGREVLDIIADLHEARGITVVLVTHDNTVAARAKRIVRIRDGRIEPNLPEGTTEATSGNLAPEPIAR
jgi:putative ABC transport system ATP-binding protein